MMLAWKMSSCIAAGNTCVLKPAEVSLTLLSMTFEMISVADVILNI